MLWRRLFCQKERERESCCTKKKRSECFEGEEPEDPADAADAEAAEAKRMFCSFACRCILLEVLAVGSGWQHALLCPAPSTQAVNGEAHTEAGKAPPSPSSASVKIYAEFRLSSRVEDSILN